MYDEKITFNKKEEVSDYDLISFISKLDLCILDKKTNEKIFNVLQVIRRVLFSTDNSKINNPLFFCIVTADIKNGFEIKQIFHLSDLKKLSFGFISQTEYQHRIVQDTSTSALIIGDSWRSSSTQRR